MRSSYIFCVTVVAFLTFPLHAADSSYPTARLLMEPDLLAKLVTTDEYVILDVRKTEAYELEHIPGAHRVEHDEWKAAFEEGKDDGGWGKRIGELGIDGDSSVVVYDGASGKDAARIWWILRYWGVRDARLLHGGWKTWKDRELPVSSKISSVPEPVAFKATPSEHRLVTKDQILATLLDRRLQIVDARSSDEFCGIEMKKNLRGGAIPGARHLEWVNLIDAETGRFKSPEELGQLFDEAGIDPSQPTASHCQSGGRASVMVFALELMGAKHAGNYHPGWSEWGNLEETPIVGAKEKEGDPGVERVEQ